MFILARFEDIKKGEENRSTKNETLKIVKMTQMPNLRKRSGKTKKIGGLMETRAA